MRSLALLAARWTSENTDALPPYGPAIVRSTFLKAGIEASADLLALYGAIGGMEAHDGKLWRLWPLDEVAREISRANEFGVLFADYLIDSWGYRVRPDNARTSAVFLDYYDGKEPILIARTLADFFDAYVQDADRLLTLTASII